MDELLAVVVKVPTVVVFIPLAIAVGVPMWVATRLAAKAAQRWLMRRLDRRITALSGSPAETGDPHGRCGGD